MKALVAGWFSFELGHATAGDLITRDVVCDWLEQAGIAYDLAVALPFQGGVDWRLVDPQDYPLVVFVCGPFEQGELEAQFLNRFRRCRLVGINLSMNVPLDQWNPFDRLIERDSSAGANPDIAFLSRRGQVPIVGICRVEEYEGAQVGAANAAIDRLIASREVAAVEIDTRLDQNSTGLHSPAEIESLIARVDALVTTRLHGFVLAIKNGIPVVAIDPMEGGAKIRRQAQVIGWPFIFNVDELTEEALRNALDTCLEEGAQEKALEARERAIELAETVHTRFVSMLTNPEELESAYQARFARIQVEENSGSRTTPGGNRPYAPASTRFPFYKSFLSFAERLRGFLQRNTTQPKR